MTDYFALAAAIATRFSTMTAPAGLVALKGSTATPPNALSVFPFVVVYPTRGTLDTDPASPILMGDPEFDVEFYYARNEGDKARETAALSKWLGVLAAQMFTGSLSVGLSPIVLRVVPTGWEIVPLIYAGLAYDGIRLGVRAKTREQVTKTP